MSSIQRYLALDVGLRRTGVAFGVYPDRVAVSLSTIAHTNADELFSAVMGLVTERKIDHVVIGLPLLPSGEEGEQSGIVRAFGKRLTDAGLAVSYLDERYSTRKGQSGDTDAMAAISVLQSFLDGIRAEGI